MRTRKVCDIASLLLTIPVRMIVIIIIMITTSNNHGLESAGLNVFEELLRC